MNLIIMMKLILIKINKEDAYDIVKILEYLEIDSDIYSVIDALVSSMTNKINKTSFTAQQKQDIGSKLKNIIDSKLPDVKNIQHVGYKVAALAKVYELIAEAWPAWQDILNQAETITNIADRGFVYVQLSMAMPSRHTAKKKQKQIRKFDFHKNLIGLLKLGYSKIGNLIHGFLKLISQNTRYFFARNGFSNRRFNFIKLG